MPKVSKEHADAIKDYGAVVDRSSEVDGYTINIVTFNEGQDITDLLASLSEGKCMCPHWGYVLQGRIAVRYDDGVEETVAAGEAFYLPAGHTSWKAEAGTELVQFSPTEQLAEVDAAINRVMEARATAAQ